MVNRKSLRSKGAPVENGMVNGGLNGRSKKDSSIEISRRDSSIDIEEDDEPAFKLKKAQLQEVNGLIETKPERKRSPHSKKLPPTLAERRLNAQSTSKNVEMRSESQAVLLSQGLMANDATKIDAVLEKCDTKVIQATLDELPIQHIIPLLRAIEQRLRTRKALDIRPWIRWAQLCFSTHLSYLSSQVSSSTSLSCLLDWMRGRTGEMHKLLALHGKLSVLSEEIESRRGGERKRVVPLLTFDNDEESKSEEDMESSDEEGSQPIGEDDWWDEEALEGGEEEEEESADDEEDEESQAEASGSEKSENEEESDDNEGETDNEAMEV